MRTHFEADIPSDGKEGKSDLQSGWLIRILELLGLTGNITCIDVFTFLNLTVQKHFMLRIGLLADLVVQDDATNKLIMLMYNDGVVI